MQRGCALEREGRRRRAREGGVAAAMPGDGEEGGMGGSGQRRRAGEGGVAAAQPGDGEEGGVGVGRAGGVFVDGEHPPRGRFLLGRLCPSGSCTVRYRNLS